MSEFMAHFGPSYVETNHLSENNAVKYRLIVRGSNNDSTITTPSASVNGVGVNIDSVLRRGMITVLLTADGGLVETKVFDWYASEPARRSFETYVSGLPTNRILCMMTVDSIKFDQSLWDFMYRIGSRCLPSLSVMDIDNPETTQMNRSSYSGIFNTTMRKIALEDFVPNDNSKKTDTRSRTEVTFDTVDDIGATGIPAMIADLDSEVYTGDGTQHLIRSFTGDTKKTFSYFNLKANDILVVEAEMFVSQEAIDAGAYGQLQIEWYDRSNVWKGGDGSNQVAVANTWVPVKIVCNVPSPPDALWFGCGAYHKPPGVNVGDMSVRNSVIYQVSRDEVVREVAFGVNGIRANGLQDNGDFSNPVLRLLGISDTNKATSNEFRERG